MKAMFHTTILVLFASLYCSGVEAYDLTPPKFDKKVLRLSTDLNYLSSTANFSAEGGSHESLPGSNFYRNLSTSFGGEYVFGPHWSTSGAISLARSDSDTTSAERINVQGRDFTFALNRKSAFSFANMISYGKVVFPLNRIKATTDDSLVGESALEVLAGAWLVKDFYPMQIFANLNYDYRDEGRAHLVNYQLGAKYDLEGIYFGGNIKGNAIAKDDDFVQTANRRTDVTTRVNGGSLAFYSVNPQRISANLWMAFDLTATNYLYFGYERSLTGKNASLNDAVFVGASWDFDISTDKTPVTTLINKKSEQEVNQFTIESEKYEDKLFDEKAQHERRKKKKKEKELLDETQKNLESEPQHN